MWQGTGPTNKWKLSCYSPRVLVVLLVFLLICSRRGGATAAILTLDTAVDESREKMADRVVRSPARLCSRDGKLCKLSAPSCFFAFLPSFHLFFLFSSLILVCLSSNCCLVRAACHLLLFGKQRVLLVSFVFCLISGSLFFLFAFIFRGFLLPWLGLFVVLSYPVRWHLICLPWLLVRELFFEFLWLSHSVTT